MDAKFRFKLITHLRAEKFYYILQCVHRVFALMMGVCIPGMRVAMPKPPSMSRIVPVT